MKLKPWISPKVEVRLSPTEGKGVFTNQKILSGEVVGVFGGIVTPEKDLPELRKKVSEDKLCLDHAMYIYPGFLLLHDYENGCDPLCFVNHSCDANAQVVNGIVLVAKRNIELGAEVNWNYKETDDIGDWNYEFKCNCGSKNCTGFVRVGPKYRQVIVQTV
jgi:SET domain-containing protein